MTPTPPPFFQTLFGSIHIADSLDFFRTYVENDSIDLIVTSPPFGLVREKAYGNKPAEEYVAWFRSFGAEFFRGLKDSGSLVIDIGGAWIAGQPTRSLYHFELLVMLCKDLGFHLAQEFYWWNPAKLPTPAEWVTVRRVRVKDAVNCVWWLSKTPWPKASNRRVLIPYSDAMKDLLQNGYDARLRPSGHDISDKFATDNGAAIPSNLLAIANTDSNGSYLRYCADNDIRPHPARFPGELPEFFMRMLTDPGDQVVDPFAGSCVVGEVSERLARRWTCIELDASYAKGAIGRFIGVDGERPRQSRSSGAVNFYRAYHPAMAFKREDESPLPPDGGRRRAAKASSSAKVESHASIEPGCEDLGLGSGDH